MIQVKIYNLEGKETGTYDLSEEIFGVEYKKEVVHQVVVAQLANKRQGTKSTLTRAEVRGGGIKPYRQKGTGRARQGSIRAPQWRKGGVVFAPKPRDFSKKVNKKMKEAALKMALSEKLRAGEFIIVDEFNLAEPKTKLVAQALKNLNIEGKTLLLTDGDSQTVVRAARNIEGVSILDAKLVSVYDLVSNGKCLLTVEAVKAIVEVIG